MSRKPEDTRFSEKQVGEILRRAAQKQSRAADSGTAENADGLTLAELRRVASEVGIRGDFIDAAVSDLTNVEARPWRVPTSFEVERVVHGEIGEAEWEEIVAELRHRTGNNGTLGQVGKTLEWYGDSGTHKLRVSVKPENGTTRIRLTSRYWDGVFLTWFLVLLAAVFVAMGTLVAMLKAGIAVLAAVGAFAGILAMTSALVAVIVRSWFGRHRQKMHELIDKVEALATEQAAVPTAAGETAEIIEPETEQLRQGL